MSTPTSAVKTAIKPNTGAAHICARHIGFLETGRSVPRRGVLLRLAERRLADQTAEALARIAWLRT
jgi:hypothetical protein